MTESKEPYEKPEMSGSFECVEAPTQPECDCEKPCKHCECKGGEGSE